MKFDSLDEWLEWQLSLHSKSIDLGLTRVAEVWRRLSTPLSSKIISVAGTNGKGSSVAFLEAIYLAAGYQTGAFTSPHLLRYNERIRLNGEEAEDQLICEAFQAIEDVRAEISLTYFEYGTLAALWCFAQKTPDVVILEVGLGGRLDAVNIVDADIALITGIALDHQDWLGDDLEVIGREKAGIMRSSHPAVFSGSDMPRSIADYASELGAELKVAGDDFSARTEASAWHWQSAENSRHALPFPNMRGKHQIQNAAGVLQVVELLMPELAVNQQAIRSGLLAARVAGRFEREKHVCDWVFDVAHNPQAASVLSDALGDQFISGTSHAIVGMLSDKDVDGVIAVLAKRFDAWHVLSLADQPRGMAEATLAQRIEAQTAGGTIQQFADATSLLKTLNPELSENDRVVVFGSFMTVAAIKQVMQQLTVA